MFKTWRFMLLLIGILAIIAACSSGDDGDDPGSDGSNDQQSDSSSSGFSTNPFADELLEVTVVEALGTGRIHDFAWSPDGTRFVMVSGGGTWLLDNLDNLSDSTGLLDGNLLMHRAVFSPTGNHFAVANGRGVFDDRGVYLYEGISGELLQTIELPETSDADVVLDIAFSPDGVSLLVLDDDGGAFEYAVESGELTRDYEMDFAGPGNVVISPDGVWFAHRSTIRANAGEDRPTVQIVNRESGEIKGLREHVGVVNAIAFLNDNRLVSVDGESMLKIWDTADAFETGASSATIETSTIRNMQVLDDGTLLQPGGLVRIIDLDTGELSNTPNNVSGSFNRQGTLSANYTGSSVQLIDVETGDIISEMPALAYGFDDMVSPPGSNSLIADLSDGSDIDFFDLDAEEITTSIDLEGRVDRCDVSADSAYLACVVGNDDQILLIDVETQEILHTLEGHISPDWAHFSADSSRLLTYTTLRRDEDDFTARVWDVATGTEVAAIEFVQSITSGAINADGTMIAISGSDLTDTGFDNNLILYDVETGAEHLSIDVDQVTASVLGFNLEGTVLFAGGTIGFNNGTLRYYDVASGDPLSGPLRVADSLFYGPAFSADRSRMVTDELDEDAHVWDVNAQQIIATLPGRPTDGFYAIRFIGDSSSRIATTDASGVLRIWEIGGSASEPVPEATEESGA